MSTLMLVGVVEPEFISATSLCLFRPLSEKHVHIQCTSTSGLKQKNLLVCFQMKEEN